MLFRAPRPEPRIPACDSPLHTACVWSEKLPFAGYSVVKDHPGEYSLGCRWRPRDCSPGPPGSLHSRGPKSPAPFRSPRRTHFTHLLAVMFRAPELLILSPALARCKAKRQVTCLLSSTRRPDRARCAGQRRGGACGAPAERECRGHSQTKPGGEYRARTGDLLVANQALSQLS